VIYGFANGAGYLARASVAVTRTGVIMQLAEKRDALMPPNPEEVLNSSIGRWFG
jgi:hypothetical protein